MDRGEWKGEKDERTWRHVECRSAAKIRGEVVRGRKPKISQLDRPALIGDQDVLRLEISVVDTHIMAELNGTQDLQEHTPDQSVIADVIALFRDAGEEVTFAAVFHDDIDTFGRIHDPEQGNHTGMLTGHVVQLDLALLALELAGVEASLVEGLDGVHDVGMDVNGGVDDAISTHAQDAG